MKVSATKNITIVGAGLVGSLLAVLLAQRGFKIDLFERNPDGRKTGMPIGRSINLALTERGRYPLQLAGILNSVDEFTIPMSGRQMHYLDGSKAFQAYGKDPSEVNYSVHRALLNHCMLDAAEATGLVNIYFNHTLEAIDFDAKQATFNTAEKGVNSSHDYQIIIGADGAFSALRTSLKTKTKIGETIDSLEHGYRELAIPPGADGNFQLDPGALHIWPRGGFMLIALPNADHSFTVTLFMAHKSSPDNPGFDQLANWQQQHDFFTQQFPDTLPLLSNLQQDFIDNPESHLATIRCQRWQYGDALLIGDAAHGIVPFHGQGMNAGFEDCSEFVRLLDAKEHSEWNDLFKAFENCRKENTDAIADMALENYAIMRDRVMDQSFLLRKQLEHELERRFPDKFIGRYSLVMFHRTPYAEVYKTGIKQDLILDELLDGAESIAEINWGNAEKLLKGTSIN